MPPALKTPCKIHVDMPVTTMNKRTEINAVLIVVFGLKS
jgi:hypothetical protein